MLKTLYQSIAATLVIAVIACGVYPLLVTGVGQALFRDKANGSLINRSGKVVGSRLIGQSFSRPEYFHGRPSSAVDAGGNGYDATNSSGSNLGPTNQKFADTLKAKVGAVLKDNPTLKAGEIPNDLVTASGSGLDPHVSPDAAMVQVERVARARGVESERIRGLVREYVEKPQLGILGEPVVNVLLLNLDLDRRFPMKG